MYDILYIHNLWFKIYDTLWIAGKNEVECLLYRTEI